MAYITESENEISECQRRVELKNDEVQALKQESELQLNSMEEKLKLKMERKVKEVEKDFEFRIAELNDDKTALKR